MDFNTIVKDILEDFTAPTDTNRPVKVRPSGKFGTVNPQLNEPHSTKSISGFKGQPGGKQKTLKFVLPKKIKTTKKNESKQQQPS
jgi:hypothetical protein